MMHRALAWCILISVLYASPMKRGEAIEDVKVIRGILLVYGVKVLVGIDETAKKGYVTPEKRI